MEIKKIVLSLIALTVIFQSNGQDIVDTSILFSQSNYGGNARIQGVGGPQTSLGGDLSSIVSNPAGLGMFNRSIFSFSTGLNFINTQSDYFGTTATDQKVNLNISNIGVVLAWKINSELTKFKNNSFGISYSRINDFHQQFAYQGRSGSSMLDHFLDQAQGVHIDDFNDENTSNYSSLEGLAARTELILTTKNEDDMTGSYQEYTSDITGDPSQTETIAIKGMKNQLSFSYGVNYDDILFLGAGIGLTSIDYDSRKIYSESNFLYDDPDYTNPLNQFSLKENLTISGTGINATLGVIFRPIDFVQIGSSLTTPTYYNLEDEYDANLNVDYSAFSNLSAESNIILSKYSLSTPVTLSGGVTIFIRKQGFLSASIEMLNYGKSHLKSDDYITLEDNQYINTSYGRSYNVKVGGEFKYDIFRFRAGYTHCDDPATTKSNNKQQITGGIGLHMKRYFLDLAIVNTTYDTDYSPYPLENLSPMALVHNNNTKGVITLGVNF